MRPRRPAARCRPVGCRSSRRATRPRGPSTTPRPRDPTTRPCRCATCAFPDPTCHPGSGRRRAGRSVEAPRDLEQRAHVLRGGAVDAHRNDVTPGSRQGDRLGERLAGGGRGAIAAGVRDPGRDAGLVEQPDEHARLADGRDRLDGEHVRAGRDERIDPRSVERLERRVARVVVAAILGAVREHRAVRPHRSRDEHPARVAARGRLFLEEPFARALRELDAAPDRLERRRAGRGRPRRTPRRSPGSWP